MDFVRYQNVAMTYRTASADKQYALLNLSGEVGELHSLIAKAIRDGYGEDYHLNVSKEIGDILWMLAAIADDHNMSLEDIAQANIKKLEDRKQRNVIAGSGNFR